MTLLERLVLGGWCAGRALRPAARPVFALPWVLGLLPAGLALVLLAWCAHPAVSPLMAPLLRAWAGEPALRYPDLYQLLPGLVEMAQRISGGLLTPLVAGASAHQFLAHWRAQAPAPARAWRAAFARWPALVLAGAAAPCSAWLVGWGASALEGQQVSEFTRTISPLIGGLIELLVVAFVALGPAAVVEAGGAGWGGLARLPARAARGYPAVLVIAGAVALLSAGASQALALLAVPIEARVPEFAAAAAALLAAWNAALACAASGALALAWRALEEGERP